MKPESLDRLTLHSWHVSDPELKLALLLKVCPIEGKWKVTEEVGQF